jgi:hypothetical protein
MMRKIAAITAVALCAGAFATAHAAGSLNLAERSGFLLGAAHHCGIATDRVVQVGQRMMTVIARDGEDAQAAALASKRFAEFFVATSTASEGKITVRCDAVAAEFSRLERHTRTIAPAPGRAPSPDRG